jgi:AcrR family transcriptional regulator
MRSKKSVRSKEEERIGRVAGTRERILSCAGVLFADGGFDAVATRQITLAAQANIAAIGYYFGSKENLIRETFASVVRPINAERLRRLDQALKLRRRGNAALLEDILKAFVEPALHSPRGNSPSYHRIMVYAFASCRPFIDQIVRRENDHVARRFCEVLCLTCPELSEEDVWWRYDFAIGSLIHILLDQDRGGRLKKLSGGACHTDDPDAILKHLVSSITAIFSAPSLDGKRRKTSSRVVKLAPQLKHESGKRRPAP